VPDEKIPIASRNTSGLILPMTRLATCKLTADLSGLTIEEREMLGLFIQAASRMDEVFWHQAYGDREPLLDSIQDPEVRKLIEINYGPWDRLDGDRPLLEEIERKPQGANFYPEEMAREEFEKALASEDHQEPESLSSLYSLVRRDNQGLLYAIPYHEAYQSAFRGSAELLQKASTLSQLPQQKRYLEARSEALLKDQYRSSDLTWMEMKDNSIDLVIGPIETYEDRLFGYKAAAEAYVLVKDHEWSQRLGGYTDLLPTLQKELPVPAIYKEEDPGEDSDLNVYDVVYYAGDCNAGAKTIAINLPNDEEVQLQKGARRLQLKNAMQAKFDLILTPIAQLLISDDQTRHITFDAFFTNTLFHEVAHGLGIKHTVNGRGPVRKALQDQATTLEEGKADILSLFIVELLFQKGFLGTGDLKDHYVTFLAGIFRSIRFGTSSAHAQANLARLNFLRQMGAVSRDGSTGNYRVEFENMQEAVALLAERILRFQGDGNCAGVRAFMKEMGVVDKTLHSDLSRLSDSGIPVDVVFEQGLDVLNQAAASVELESRTRPN